MSLQEKNNEFFNNAAKYWDTRQDVRQLANDAANIIIQMVKFDPATTECLEFGCGTGKYFRTQYNTHVYN